MTPFFTVKFTGKNFTFSLPFLYQFRFLFMVKFRKLHQVRALLSQVVERQGSCCAKRCYWCRNGAVFRRHFLIPIRVQAELNSLVLCASGLVARSLQTAAGMRLTRASPEPQNPARLSLSLNAHWNYPSRLHPDGWRFLARFGGFGAPFFARARNGRREKRPTTDHGQRDHGRRSRTALARGERSMSKNS